MCTKFAVSVILKTHTWSTFSKWALHNNAHTPKISENSPGYESEFDPSSPELPRSRIPVDPDKSIEKRENSFCYPAYFQSTLTSIEKYLRRLFLNIKTRVLQHRNMPTSLEDFRFMKHERRKNDVTLRQHDICCFENNFLQTKYWPAVWL